MAGAIDQIETSYMDYLEDAKLTIDEAEAATACWLYQYDGLDPAPTFFEDAKKLMTPVSAHLAQKTLPMLKQFAEEHIDGDIETSNADSDQLMSLEQLGISVSTEGYFN